MRDIKVSWNEMYLQGRVDWEKAGVGGGEGGEVSPKWESFLTQKNNM